MALLEIEASKRQNMAKMKVIVEFWRRPNRVAPLMTGQGCQSSMNINPRLLLLSRKKHPKPFTTNIQTSINI
jgi:hypothetical protein